MWRQTDCTCKILSFYRKDIIKNLKQWVPDQAIHLSLKRTEYKSIFIFFFHKNGFAHENHEFPAPGQA